MAFTLVRGPEYPPTLAQALALHVFSYVDLNGNEIEICETLVPTIKTGPVLKLNSKLYQPFPE